MKNKKKIKLIVFISIIAVLAIGIITTIIITESLKRDLPSVVGLDENEAAEVLQEAGFTVEVEHVYNSKYEKGKVAFLSSSFSRKENGWSYSEIESSRYNYLKTVYVLVSKGPSGFITKNFHHSLTIGDVGSLSWQSSLIGIEYMTPGISYFFLTITKANQKITFFDEGNADFESDVTNNISCDYTHSINGNGNDVIRFVVPQEELGDLLPARLSYVLKCFVNGNETLLKIEINDIVWEKRALP